tara:strand:+ start:2186 stop:2392 length:207 start_codon:yes stop_codon:yes gene_type:complete
MYKNLKAERGEFDGCVCVGVRRDVVQKSEDLSELCGVALVIFGALADPVSDLVDIGLSDFTTWRHRAG